MKKILVGACAALTMTSSLAMADTPVMFSTLNGFNAPAADSVKGVRLAVLYGKTGNVTGVDFALIGMSESDNLVGVNFPLIIGANKVNDSMTGASLGLFNWHTGNDLGANLGFVNLTNNVKGVNFSFVNVANNVKGLNWAAVNYSKGDSLVDLGFANISEHSTVQLGIFNMTSEIKGVQIGLINCAKNGFLPCFPIVNFSK